MKAWITAAALATAAWSAQAAAQPGSVQGFSQEGLDRVHEIMHEEVDHGQVPSASAIISRNGEIVFERYYGTMGEGEPVGEDTIMRMASIGKTVTAAVVLSLYEDGLLLIDDPVSDHLPSFANTQVRETDPETGRTRLVEPDGTVTIRHLLTHTAGLQRYSDEVNALWGEASTVRAFADGIAALPLRHHPGAGYAYGNAYEVLAAVAEAASGVRFDALVRDRILDPLGMDDTHFFVPEDKLDQLSAMYTRDEDGGLIEMRARSQEESPQTYFAGGGGLRASVGDYHRFVMMLLNEGERDGARVLSPKSVRLMTRDHVGEDRPGAREGDWGWGFGMAVRRRVLDGEVGTAGAFGWNGGTGTWYFADPEERLAAVIFTQLNPGNPHDLRERFERAVYLAIEEPYADREDG